MAALAALAACATHVDAPAPAIVRTPLEAAVMRDDVAAVGALVAAGGDVNAVGAGSDSPLMLAALYGDAQLVTLLLAHHADVHHANAAGATALHWAVDDLAKARLLLDAGADPSAADSDGVTPLATAALHDGGAPVVQLLLERGAAVGGAHDGPIPSIVAGGGDPESLVALLAHGADPRAHSGGGATALAEAAVNGNTASVQRLLELGAPPDPPDLFGRTPLMWAAQQGYGEIVQLLVAHGAVVDQPETFSKTTALMAAAASDRADLALVQSLLAAHAAVAPRDDEDASARVWAVRRGDAAVLAAVTAAGSDAPRTPVDRAQGEPVGAANTVHDAVARAIPLLERTRKSFRAAAHCPSCHHDALPAMALARAKTAGFAIDDAAYATEAQRTVASMQPSREHYLDGFGFADVVEPAYLLAGLDAGGYRPDELTTAMTRYLALRQRRDGGWRTMMQRIPLDGSDVTLTALAIHALARFAPPSRAVQTAAQIRVARDYLAAADAATTEDLVYKILGLAWARVPTATLAPLVDALAAGQHADGGFAQHAGLASDAYATGQVLIVLHDIGGRGVGDPAVARAVQFLLSTQITDGSWFVPTRALRFQPFIESGSPQGRSQYSSASGTAWATLALATLAR